MSIKAKILIIISILLTIATGSVYWINRDSFVKDKTSYLYSDSLERIERASSEITSEYQTYFDKIRTALYFFDSTTGQFNAGIKPLATTPEWGRIRALRMNIINDLEVTDTLGVSAAPLEQEALKVLSTLQDGRTFTLHSTKSPQYLAILYRKGNNYFEAEIQLPALQRISSEGRLSLLKGDNKDFLGGTIFANNPQLQYHFHKTFQPSGKAGATELRLDGQDYLISYKEVPVLGTFLINTVPMSSVFVVVKKITTQTLFISLGILLVGLFAVYISIDSITKNLLALTNAMSSFNANGTSAKVKIISKDEVGQIAGIYNKMLSKIDELLLHTASKTRMEAELETAKEVQETLLPSTKADTDAYVIKGFYRPASECGGDLWFHHAEDDNVLIFVGDATGHGVPAALITAAARSILSVAVNEKIWDPAKILSLINKVMCDTTKGAKMMTAFACVYNIKTYELTYSNASHEQPFIMPTKGADKITKNSLRILSEAKGKRLGEKSDSSYTNSKASLQKGEGLLLYTDGLTDAIDAEKNQFSERGLLKTIVETCNKNNNKSLHTILEKKIVEFTGDIEQPDDITFVSLFAKAA
ncbi:SpoIIE family protein phosphatase [Bdellovibrio bacteriovorus]|uniref:HAMP domain-containing protein n=1 Tax=Bdellovibrio bacteriovorus TaxID=959 RepID=A0A1Z3NC50_BDEBC|nr:SpoIIE family protein phosphatase [Bdellovibrio bacteriovorus]ASD65025.1 hypothetical protein B9G79_16345 [Bdellovibrio bacteriovorus]